MARNSKKEITGLRACRQNRRMKAARMLSSGAPRADVALGLKALFKAKRTKSYIRALWIQSELPL